MATKTFKHGLAWAAGLAICHMASANTTKPEFVELQTNLGTVAIRLDYTRAPVSANNFMDYVQKNFYRNTLLHRIVQEPIAIVQGGGFNLADGKIKPTDPPIVLESNNGLSNVAGTIAMARTEIPNSATSQFYINVEDNRGLDYRSPAVPGYAVFGTVIAGLDVATRIMNLASFNSLPYTGAASLVFIEAAYASSAYGGGRSRTRILRRGSGTVTSTPAGIACGSRCNFSQRAGTPLRLTATPSAGHVFSGWRGDCAGVNPTLSLDTAQGNHNCTALFSRLGN